VDSQSQSYITTDSQSVSMSWCRANLGLLTKVFFFKVTVLSFGGALSDERSGLSFVSLCEYSLVFSQYLHTVLHTFDMYNIYVVLDTFGIYNIYVVLDIFTIKYNMYMQASVSPDSVQQIMPYLLGTTAV
jgi:hypothetical protein